MSVFNDEKRQLCKVYLAKPQQVKYQNLQLSFDRAIIASDNTGESVLFAG